MWFFTSLPFCGSTPSHCRYWTTQGQCYFGDECRFVHDPAMKGISSIAATTKPDQSRSESKAASAADVASLSQDELQSRLNRTTPNNLTAHDSTSNDSASGVATLSQDELQSRLNAQAHATIIAQQPPQAPYQPSVATTSSTHTMNTPHTMGLNPMSHTAMNMPQNMPFQSFPNTANPAMFAPSSHFMPDSRSHFHQPQATAMSMQPPKNSDVFFCLFCRLPD